MEDESQSIASTGDSSVDKLDKIENNQSINIDSENSKKESQNEIKENENNENVKDKFDVVEVRSENGIELLNKSSENKHDLVVENGDDKTANNKIANEHEAIVDQLLAEIIVETVATTKESSEIDISDSVASDEPALNFQADDDNNPIEIKYESSPEKRANSEPIDSEDVVCTYISSPSEDVGTGEKLWNHSTESNYGDSNEEDVIDDEENTLRQVSRNLSQPKSSEVEVFELTDDDEDDTNLNDKQTRPIVHKDQKQKFGTSNEFDDEDDFDDNSSIDDSRSISDDDMQDEENDSDGMDLDSVESIHNIDDSDDDDDNGEEETNIRNNDRKIVQSASAKKSINHLRVNARIRRAFMKSTLRKFNSTKLSKYFLVKRSINWYVSQQFIYI